MSQIPELLERRVVTALDQRFNDRVPADVKDQLEYVVQTRARSVTLIERRPAWRQPGEFTDHRIAQLRLDEPATHRTFPRRHQSDEWPRHALLPAQRSFERLNDETGADPRCMLVA